MRVLTHLGLGDMLITYPIIMELSKRYGTITLACKHKYKESISELYKNKDIVLEFVSSEGEFERASDPHKYNYLKIGYTSACESESLFGEEFYRQVGLPYKTRWEYSIQTDAEQLYNADVFVHDTEEFKINIDGFRPSEFANNNILSYISMLENAREVHVIESSFKQLLEYLNPKGKLFLHKFNNKSFRVVPSKHEYTIINHD